MDMESSPSSWPKVYKFLDVSRGAEAVLWEGNWGMGRPLGLAAWQDGAPDIRRGVAHQRHAGGSGIAANHIVAGPEHGPRNVRSRTRPVPSQHGPGPGRQCSDSVDPAVLLVRRRSFKL